VDDLGIEVESLPLEEQLEPHLDELARLEGVRGDDEDSAVRERLPVLVRELIPAEERQTEVRAARGVRVVAALGFALPPPARLYRQADRGAGRRIGAGESGQIRSKYRVRSKSVTLPSK
jgi:hypothetical protein